MAVGWSLAECEIAMKQQRDTLYQDMVVQPSEDISQGILLDSTARDDLRANGLDPDAVLDGLRQTARDMLKDMLRPRFYQRVEELGLWR